MSVELHDFLPFLKYLLYIVGFFAFILLWEWFWSYSSFALKRKHTSDIKELSMLPEGANCSNCLYSGWTDDGYQETCSLYGDRSRLKSPDPRGFCSSYEKSG